MLIVYRRMNGMCNQFQSLAHQIATLLDGNIKGSIISVRFEYKEYFPNLKNMKMVKLYDSKIAEKILTFCYKITRNLLRNNRIFFDYHYYSDEGEKLEKYIYSEGFRYLNAFSGWPYYDQKAFLKHETQIRELFALSKDIEGKVTVQLQDMRKHCDILIGVHIRRGDYKEFKNGEYYYTDEQYIDTCEKLKNIINGRVGFVLSSNDVINIEQWRQKLGGDVWKENTNTGLEDVSLLSKTDYIIGPPSTFNGWASFMGNVGRFWMTPQKMCPDSLADFKIHFKED